MASQKDLICKYDGTKVDIGIKKSKGAKTQSCDKSIINKIVPKKINSGASNKHEPNNDDTNESHSCRSDDINKTKNLNIS